MLRICTAVLVLGAALTGLNKASAAGYLWNRLHCCPPPLHHCEEGCPCIKRCCGCPKPVCNPCVQPNWGYYQPCWSPWPWPPDWSHCPVMPPAAIVHPPGSGGDLVMPGPESLAPPRQYMP